MFVRIFYDIFLGTIGINFTIINLIPFICTNFVHLNTFKIIKKTYDLLYVIFLSILPTLFFIHNGTLIFGDHYSSCQRLIYQSYLSVLTIIATTNRMIFDVAMLIVDDASDCKITIIHHLLCIVGNIFCMVHNHGHVYLMLIILSEYSTIFLNLRIFYSSVLNISNDCLDKIVLVLFTLSFFVTRIINMPFLQILGLHDYFNCKDTPSELIIVSVPSFLLMLMSYYWFIFKIIPLCKVKLFNHKKLQ